MKKKISQTVLEYVKKNPLQLTCRWLDYLRRKKYKVIEQGNNGNNSYGYLLIFPDNSKLVGMETTVINDNDYMVSCILSVTTDDDTWTNKQQWTQKQIDDVN